MTGTGASVQIRTATTGDAEAIKQCVAAAYQQYVPLMDQLPAPMLDDYESLIARGVVRVADVAGQVNGLIVMWQKDDHFYIDNVAVDPSAQGLGVGAALLADADRAARDSGHAEIRLYTNEIMAANIDYYPRRGFVETHRAVENGYRRIYFSRRL